MSELDDFIEHANSFVPSHEDWTELLNWVAQQDHALNPLEIIVKMASIETGGNLAPLMEALQLSLDRRE